MVLLVFFKKPLIEVSGIITVGTLVAIVNEALVKPGDIF